MTLTAKRRRRAGPKRSTRGTPLRIPLFPDEETAIKAECDRLDVNMTDYVRAHVPLLRGPLCDEMVERILRDATKA